MADKEPSLLIVEDDLDVADMLTAYFRVQGYDVQTVNWGEDCLRACEAARPDLIILDIRLPDIDGYEIARRLRNDRRTANIPIIFLTEKRERADRLEGLQLGADDYITKPFDVQELRLRIRNALRRHTQGLRSNPVTGLAERELVDEHLRDCLNSAGWALIAVQLENVHVFREAYGFVASDDVLRAVSLMLQNAIRDAGSPTDFLGQLSAAEFLIISRTEHLEALSDRIRDRIEQSLEYFYPVRDRERGLDPDTRLNVRLGRLAEPEGPYLDLDHLKTELVRRIQ